MCERERYKQTDRQAERRRNKQSLAYLSQFLHLVGADVRAVSESKVKEDRKRQRGIERERDREKGRERERKRETHTHS